jgi:hypothetical protein
MNSAIRLFAKKSKEEVLFFWKYNKVSRHGTATQSFVI